MFTTQRVCSYHSSLCVFCLWLLKRSTCHSCQEVFTSYLWCLSLLATSHNNMSGGPTCLFPDSQVKGDSSCSVDSCLVCHGLSGALCNHLFCLSLSYIVFLVESSEDATLAKWSVWPRPQWLRQSVAFQKCAWSSLDLKVLHIMNLFQEIIQLFWKTARVQNTAALKLFEQLLAEFTCDWKSLIYAPSELQKYK